MGNVANRHRFRFDPFRMLSQHFSPMVGATVAVTAVAVEEALKCDCFLLPWVMLANLLWRFASILFRNAVPAFLSMVGATVAVAVAVRRGALKK